MIKRGVSGNPFRILLVEDNAGDADLVTEAFSRSKNEFAITSVTNGEAALAFLKQEKPYESAESPDLIILDLNLPRMDGREVLSVVKKDVRLMHLPIIVLSSSSAERDLADSYHLLANCFMTKPVDLHDFFQMAEDIDRFWFASVKLPPRLSAYSSSLGI